MNASRPETPCDEAQGPRSLAAVAASLATCRHPRSSHLRVPQVVEDDAAARGAASWCSACGALYVQGAGGGTWRSPTLTSRLTRRHFEELVLLLHAIVQLAQLARTHAPAGVAGSPAHVFLRNVRASLTALDRLAIVREVDRLEEVLAQIPRSAVH
jgi:hypothetical protein